MMTRHRTLPAIALALLCACANHPGGDAGGALRTAPSPGDADGNTIPDIFEEGLARKFAPALALGGRDLWPVEVSYLWAEGAPLMRQAYRPRDGRELRREKVLAAESLNREDWSKLPERGIDPGTKEPVRYRYFVDGPGKNLGPGAEDMDWSSAFRRVQGAGLLSPRTARFPPTFYVHFFKPFGDDNLLGIQYWMYLPYNKWINNHEGDFELINVVVALKGEGRSRFDPALPNQTLSRVRLFFHNFYRDWTDEAALISGPEGGTHPVVYVGGWGRLRLGLSLWEGRHSGASYPRPGRYLGVGGGLGPFRPSSRVGEVNRWLAPEDFRTIVLPEPDRFSAAKAPELSWYLLPFRPGDLVEPVNFWFMRLIEADRSPFQIARHRRLNGAVGSDKRWGGLAQTLSRLSAPVLPPEWAARRVR